MTEQDTRIITATTGLGDILADLGIGGTNDHIGTHKGTAGIGSEESERSGMGLPFLRSAP